MTADSGDVSILQDVRDFVSPYGARRQPRKVGAKLRRSGFSPSPENIAQHTAQAVSAAGLYVICRRR